MMTVITMELEQKINDTFFNRIRKSLTGKIVAYGFASTLALGGLTSCIESSSSADSLAKPVANCGQKTVFYNDNDGDGYGNPTDNILACSQPAGYVTNNLDPDDTNVEIFPGCLTNSYYRDTDGDSYGNATNSILACSQPAGYVTNNLDANDTNVAIYPGCTPNLYCRDNDGDGYGNPNNNIWACFPSTGYITDCTDSNDNNANIN